MTASDSRDEAMAALRQGDWASTSTGIRWFREHATGDLDFSVVSDTLRFHDLVPMGIAAETLVLRYGIPGLCEVITYLVSDGIECNAHEYLLGVIEDLYHQEDVPIRGMLVAMASDNRYASNRLAIVEMLDAPYLAADMQGILKEL
ncbi:hypothetical protein CPI83_29795 (plasmid) [Rhodococcus sp. H-CA8f]|uniref:hypothetical protein n=1 Tax=Rhodococcus sp. H-CA8f TaxID=1727214 RepID=UPI000BE3F86B|nr:hypothetical protein [Rhodococcus sp. H-CA8f]ATI36393.1 hypothetical protein CPI83_29795 [Rhodococcus sp. H-CA8f]